IAAGTKQCATARRRADSRCPDAAVWARMTVTASGERPVSAPGHFGGAVIGDHAAIHYRTIVLAAGCILGPDQVSITAPVNHLPRVPAGVFAGCDGTGESPPAGARWGVRRA